MKILHICTVLTFLLIGSPHQAAAAIVRSCSDSVLKASSSSSTSSTNHIPQSNQTLANTEGQVNPVAQSQNDQKVLVDIDQAREQEAKRLLQTSRLPYEVARLILTYQEHVEPLPIEQRVNEIAGELAPKRQKEIARTLYQLTKLPDELIKLVIDYEAQIFSRHTDAIIVLVALSNNRLGSASKDQTIRIWDIKTGKCLKLLQHTMAVTAIAALPHDEIAAGEGDNSIKIWNINTGLCRTILTGHNNPVAGLVALPNNQLASGAESTDQQVPWLQSIDSGIIYIWDLTTGDLIGIIDTQRPVLNLWICHNNTLAFATAADGGNPKAAGITIIDPIVNRILDRKFNYHSSLAKISGFIPLVQNKMLTAADDENIFIYGFPSQSTWRDTTYKKYTPFWTKTMLSWPITLALLANNKLATGGWSDNKIRIIDTETASCEKEYPVDVQTTALVALPNNQLAVGSMDGRIAIVNLDQEKT